jgi:hypothetical protein
MLTSNPFTDLSATLTLDVIQTYVILMFLLVMGGTIFDVIHKKSGVYFFRNWKKSKQNAKKSIDNSQLMSIATSTAVHDVLTSGEFCNPKRRMAHLLTMYGFILYVVTTVIMVFSSQTSTTVPALWSLGAFMVCLGGYWFWFFIRVDVSAEGQSPFRLTKADLFVVSLVTSTTFALLWAYAQASGNALYTTVFLILYIITSTVLFASVPWSKFAHMFFKPAAAFEKRMSKANGSAQNLPTQTRDEPEQQKRHSMELLQDAPMHMGLGIKREAPRHY